MNATNSLFSPQMDCLQQEQQGLMHSLLGLQQQA
jgi:hypothetical protein